MQQVEPKDIVSASQPSHPQSHTPAGRRRADKRLFSLVALLTCVALLLGLLYLVFNHKQPAKQIIDMNSHINVPMPSSAFPLYFASDVTYTSVLRSLTDLGLQPAVFCGLSDDAMSEYIIRGDYWLPAGQRNMFQEKHRLYVITTQTTAPDVLLENALKTLPGIQNNVAQQAKQTVYCTNGITQPHQKTPTGAPPLFNNFNYSVPLYLYARVTFTAATDYDTALYDVSNLGLRLADPCYERTPTTSTSAPKWHSMGQEASFAKTHMLVVAPAPMTTAITWVGQLHTLPDVSAVTTPYTAFTC